MIMIMIIIIFIEPSPVQSMSLTGLEQVRSSHAENVTAAASLLASDGLPVFRRWLSISKVCIT